MTVTQDDLVEEISKEIKEFSRECTLSFVSDMHLVPTWTDHYDEYDILRELLLESSLSKKQIDRIIRSILSSYTAQLLRIINNESGLQKKGKLALLNESGDNVGHNLKSPMQVEMNKINVM